MFIIFILIFIYKQWIIFIHPETHHKHTITIQTILFKLLFYYLYYIIFEVVHKILINYKQVYKYIKYENVSISLDQR